jgi:hypothetical protein
MAKCPPRKKPQKPRLEPQSKRFVAKVLELEAAGELNTTEPESDFERAFKKIVSPKADKKRYPIRPPPAL